MSLWIQPTAPPCGFPPEVLCGGAVLPGRRACVPDDRGGRARQPSVDGERHLAALRPEDGRFVFDAGAPFLRTESPHRVRKGWEHRVPHDTMRSAIPGPRYR